MLKIYLLAFLKKIKWLTAVFSLLFISRFFTGCSDGQNNAEKPNILLIFTDQQSANDMSCAGNTYVDTPNLDNLAAEGTMFALSYCTAPVCSPSRSSIITGKMPHETGVTYNGDVPEKSIPDMGEIFRKAGYDTYWAGKWHLPESYPLRSESKQRQVRGFDLLPFYDSTKNWPEWGLGDTTDSYLADAVVRFLETKSHDKPFLMAVSFCDPHDICYVPRRKDTFKKADEIKDLPPLPENFGIPENEPGFVNYRRNMDYYGDEINFTKDWTKEDWQVYRYHYFRMTERVDHEIGKIIKAMKRNKLFDNTLIIFTSDHGDGEGAHHWAAKLNFYEEASKVPFIITWPGHIPANKTDSTHLVSGMDILPTMCDYAGINDAPGFTGNSLHTLLTDKRPDWRQYLVVELADDPRDTTRIGRMVRTQQFKYTHYSSGANPEQFFNIKKDPGEMNNLINDSIYTDEIEKHRKMLENEVIETHDKEAEELLFEKKEKLSFLNGIK